MQKNTFLSTCRSKVAPLHQPAVQTQEAAAAKNQQRVNLCYTGGELRTVRRGVRLHFPVLLSSHVSFNLGLCAPPASSNPFSDVLRFPELLTKL